MSSFFIVTTTIVIIIAVNTHAIGAGGEGKRGYRANSLGEHMVRASSLGACEHMVRARSLGPCVAPQVEPLKQQALK